VSLAADAPPWTTFAPCAGKSKSAKRMPFRVAKIEQHRFCTMTRRKETLTSKLRGWSGISSQLDVDETLNWTEDVDVRR